MNIYQLKWISTFSILFSILFCNVWVQAEEIDKMAWPDIKALFATTDVAIVPIGATEQTGPHLPTGTDYFVAEWLAVQVAEQCRVPMTPIVPVSISIKHQAFPGTLWVPSQVFSDYVKGICLSLAAHGIKKILIINGHGGNNSALFELTGDLRRNHGVFAAIVTGPEPSDPRDESHGGRRGTSVMRYLHDDLVQMDKAVDTQQKKTLGSLTLRNENLIGPEGGPFAKFDSDVPDLTDNGIMGAAGSVVDVKTATPEEGEKIIVPYVAELVKLVEALKKADYKTLLSKTSE